MTRHPDLDKKLDLLYALRLNKKIKSHSELAEAVGISRQAVCKWVRGSETRRGDSIPLPKVPIVSAKFEIPEQWFVLNYDQFASKVNEKVENDQLDKQAKPEKISISLLPSTPASIFGRKSELKYIDNCWKDNRANVVQVFGFGGMGKSSLVNAWLSRIERKGYKGARRIYAWSFYWQASNSEVRSSGDYFIEHALDWFGDKNNSDNTPWGKATRLASLIREKKTILILDGLEALQLPPGPKKGVIENPAVALLLKELAMDNNGLCIITSRLEVTDISTFQSPKNRKIPLGKIGTNAGIRLLKGLDLKGVHSDFVLAINQYNRHPLSLSLLGGYLNVVHAGQVANYKNIESLFDESSVAIQVKNIMQNYLKWFKDSPELSLLYLMAMLDRATTLRELAKLIDKNSDASELTKVLNALSSTEFSYVIDRLRQSNLLTLDHKEKEVYVDCHPLVRDFVAHELKSRNRELWVEGHTLIFRYLQNGENSEPCSVADLEPLFRAVIHGTQAELYDEAYTLYFEKIKNRFIMLTGGNQDTDQACIQSFFDASTGRPVNSLTDESKFFLLSCAASNYMSLGMLSEAGEPCLQSIEWYKANKKWLQAANTVGPYLSMLFLAGKLERAIEIFEEFSECIRLTNNNIVEAMSWIFKAHALHLAGNDLSAEKLFVKAEKIIIQSSPSSPVSFPTISSYYCKFLLETGHPELAIERSLKTLSWRESNSWQTSIDSSSIYAGDIQILGLAYLEVRDFSNAKLYLERLVDILKEANEWLYLPAGLNARSKYYSATGNYKAAEADLLSALSISRRIGAKFDEWESLLNLAKLKYEEKEIDKSKSYLEQFEKVEGMELYKFRDKEIQRLREALGG